MQYKFFEPYLKARGGEVPPTVESYLTVFMSGGQYREFFKQSGFESARLKPLKLDIGFHNAGGLPTEIANLSLSCYERLALGLEPLIKMGRQLIGRRKKKGRRTEGVNGS